MTDLQRMNLRGPVRHVITNRAHEIKEEQTFDKGGRLIAVRRLGPGSSEWRLDVRATDRPASGFVVERTDGLDGWSMEGLHGINFGTQGAHVARTRMHRGTPQETVLEDSAGTLVSTIRYDTDEQGRVIEAAQLLSTQALDDSGLLDLPEELSNSQRPDIATPFVRVLFVYGPPGLIEYSVHMGGQLIGQSHMSYNAQGDPETVADGSSVVRFDYDYDAYGNWTRRLTRHLKRTEEVSRHLTYYDD